MRMSTTIHLVAGAGSAGQVVREVVLVRQSSPDTYEVLASPGLVLGVAAGDTIRLTAPGEFDVVARGGNVCVQLFRGSGVAEVEELATRRLSSVGGWLDGRSAKQLVYTVPASAGFGPLEQALGQVVARFPDVEWFYGNVYDPKDGVTPLDWWK